MEKKFTFNIFAFIFTFLFGLIYVYLNVPKPKIIIKYPTPYNAQKLTYKGLSEDCYKFKVDIVDCDKDLFEQPII